MTDDPSELVARAYDELRAVAAGLMTRERTGHTLQPTALVNEAFLRLVDADDLTPNDRGHFVGIAARVLRRVLVEHARARGTDKRGGGAHRVTLDSRVLGTDAAEVDTLALDEALDKLGALDGRPARVVELRFFGGLTIAETADALGVSKRTAELDWSLARAFLRRELER